ncbi:tubulin alpha-8 chain-like isoform X2 [Chelonus insularis]|nr:tubulin alpha-8 chain-like isoform X2 [Chelonus insularis]
MSDGYMSDNYYTDDNSYHSFFTPTQSGKFTPRTLMIDSEPTVIDEIRIGPYKCLYDPTVLITGKEDAANNFARGYYRTSEEIIELVLNGIRGVSESCSNLLGFLIFRSSGGGTGSGFTTSMLERLETDFGKVSKFNFTIYPAPNISTAVVEPYNSVLTIHRTIKYEDCCFIIDNEALYDICTRNLDINRPTYTNLNRLKAQIVSGLTTSLRFEGSFNVGLDELRTNLVPYPRLHFPLITHSPILTPQKLMNQLITVSSITNECFRSTNQMVKCDPRKGSYISCCMLYRGNVSPSDVNSTISSLKNNKTIKFVKWNLTAFKIGISYQPSIAVPDSDLGKADKSITMLSNNTIIHEAWVRLLEKFDLMFQRKSFVHHYLNEGLEESEFVNAKENISSLIDDYKNAENDYTI